MSPFTLPQASVRHQVKVSLRAPFDKKKAATMPGLTAAYSG